MSEHKLSPLLRHFVHKAYIFYITSKLFASACNNLFSKVCKRLIVARKKELCLLYYYF